MPVATSLRVVAASLAVGAMVIVSTLVSHDGDITGLIKFGDAPVAQPVARHAADEIGREVVIVGEGHDGMYFFLQALDTLNIAAQLPCGDAAYVCHVFCFRLNVVWNWVNFCAGG